MRCELWNWSGDRRCLTSIEQGSLCVREILLWRFSVEQALLSLAAKRRKNTAHGESRGNKWEMIQPQRGERGFHAHSYCPAVLSSLLAIFTPLSPSTYLAMP